MGTAELCVDQHLGRDVLIKALHPGVDQRRIADEVSALTSIRSKHVVELYDVIRDDDGDIIAIVEEYLPGSDLVSIIPLTTLDDFLKVSYALACGVADIHAAGRVHRDIKPANMKFDAERCLKIFDFGLSRPEDDGAKTKGAIGTEGYMAPELCTDDEDEVVEFTNAVDAYAFGATLVRAARGTLPKDLRRDPPILPCSEADFNGFALGIPAEVADLLNLCLSENPAQRPSMAEIRDTIKKYLVKDRHRALLVAANSVHVLDARRRSVNIGANTLGSATLTYDGLNFKITVSSGQVFVNNIPVSVPHTLPGACVVTLGGAELGYNRTHFTVDISHPEVVL